jgi:hypothetical protein
MKLTAVTFIEDCRCKFTYWAPANTGKIHQEAFLVIKGGKRKTISREHKVLILLLFFQNQMSPNVSPTRQNLSQVEFKRKIITCFGFSKYIKVLEILLATCWRKPFFLMLI